MGAVCEWIPIPALERAESFFPASVADGRIRRYLGSGFAARAFGNPEVVIGGEGVDKLTLDCLDFRKRRGLGLQTGAEIVDILFAASGPDQHAIGVVKNFANKVVFLRKPPHIRPETNTLDRTAYPNHGMPHINLLFDGWGGKVGGHWTKSQSMTRLLPESAMTRVLPWALTQ